MQRRHAWRFGCDPGLHPTDNMYLEIRVRPAHAALCSLAALLLTLSLLLLLTAPREAHGQAALRGLPPTHHIQLQPDVSADDRAPRSVPSDGDTLDSLVTLALRSNPSIRAAASRAVAAHAGIAPAGARPDPMLMAGIQNLPISSPGFSAEMTMKMVGVSQAFPYPGKLGLATRAAEYGFAAARDNVAQAKLDVVRDVEEAYYDLVFADRALEIVQRNASVLQSLVSVSEAQYTTGIGTQSDVLRARTEAAGLSVQASQLTIQRRTALAQLNAVLDRAGDVPVNHPAVPARLRRAAVADSADQIHFVSTALGAPATDSPLLPLDSLQALEVVHNPQLRAQEATIAAQSARVALARKATLPDINVALSYGQRQDRSDMVSATVSIPIPLQRGRKQYAEVAAANADLTALEASQRNLVNTIRADIARRAGDIEQARTELALYKRAILPQAQATFASATASYQVGRVDFNSLVNAQAAVFNYETAYWRSLTNVAKAIAELERIVGAEVLR